MSEIPVHPRPRRLADWINPTGARKVHSLVDKVYQRKNLEMAWEKAKANRGSGGVDGQNLETFVGQLEQQLDRLHRELKEDGYHISLNRYGGYRSRRRVNRASFAHWETPR